MTALRRLGLGLVLVVAVIGLAPVSGAAASKTACTAPARRGSASLTRVEVWHALNPSDGKQLQRLARDFELAHPHIRIELTAKGSPLDTADEFFNTPVADRPAVVMLPGLAAQSAVDTGAVAELGPCGTGAPDVLADLLPGALAGTVVGDRPWGVPFGASGWVLVYDRAAFRRAGLDPDRAPTTLDEVSAASRAILASGAAPHGLSINDPTPLAIAAGAFGAGGAAARDEVLRWEAETLADGLTVGARTVDRDTGAPGVNALVTKQAAMAIESTLALPAAAEALRQGQAPGFELGVAAVPSPSRATTPFESYAWFLASGTPRRARDAGWSFVDWLSQPEQQARIGGTTEFLPGNRTVTATTPVDRWTTDPLLKQAWSVVSGSRPSAAMPTGALRDHEITLAMAFWSLLVHHVPADSARQETLVRLDESDAFYGRNPMHYAQCAFARPACTGDVELYEVAVADGSEQSVDRDLNGDTPVWSPDGTRVAFATGGVHATESHLVVMNADGTHRVQITSGSDVDRHPSWSPDGTRLVFQRGKDDFGGDLFVVDVDTSKTTRLTSGDATDQQPKWSPDGTRIAYASNRGGSYDLWTMDAEGANPHQITDNRTDDWWPTWSPDGRALAFMTDRDGDIAVYVVNLDGTNEHRLVSPAMTVPAWSPDGRTIATVDALTGEVYLVAADGSTTRRLTTSRGGNFTPSWSPDGSSLIMSGTRRG